MAGGDDHEVRLHDTRKAKVGAGPMQVVRGLGRGLWQVRLGKDGNTFEFRASRRCAPDDPNEVGAGDWLAYNFATGKPVKADPGKQVAVRTSADGWSVEATKDSLVWEAVHQTGVRKPVPLDPNRDEQPRCYCFIPAKKGKPTRLLVGHYYGLSVLELHVAAGRADRLATGHAGDVTSIATDEDGTWAITASVTLTLAGWSLADWPNGGLGPSSASRRQRTPVDEVDLGGPAWEMGLEGDEIIMVSRISPGRPSTASQGPT